MGIYLVFDYISFLPTKNVYIRRDFNVLFNAFLHFSAIGTWLIWMHMWLNDNYLDYISFLSTNRLYAMTPYIVCVKGVI